MEREICPNKKKKIYLPPLKRNRNLYHREESKQVDDPPSKTRRGRLPSIRNGLKTITKRENINVSLAT